MKQQTSLPEGASITKPTHEESKEMRKKEAEEYAYSSTKQSLKCQALVEAITTACNYLEHEDYGTQSESCPLCILKTALDKYNKP